MALEARQEFNMNSLTQQDILNEACSPFDIDPPMRSCCRRYQPAQTASPDYRQLPERGALMQPPFDMNQPTGRFWECFPLYQREELIKVQVSFLLQTTAQTAQNMSCSA